MAAYTIIRSENTSRYIIYPINGLTDDVVVWTACETVAVWMEHDLCIWTARWIADDDWCRSAGMRDATAELQRLAVNTNGFDVRRLLPISIRFIRAPRCFAFFCCDRWRTHRQTKKVQQRRSQSFPGSTHFIGWRHKIPEYSVTFDLEWFTLAVTQGHSR